MRHRVPAELLHEGVGRTVGVWPSIITGDASDRQKRSESSLSPEGGPIRAFMAPTLKKLMEGYPLFRGDRVERQVHRSLGVTLDVVKYVRDLLQEKYGVSI